MNYIVELVCSLNTVHYGQYSVQSKGTTIGITKSAVYR